MSDKLQFVVLCGRWSLPVDYDKLKFVGPLYNR